jgi:DnaJ-class molecular chaperone
MPNFYEVLGVSNDASESAIKKAYRSLSLKYHPDRNHDDNAKSKFQAINEAYETLSDQGRRNQYDMELQGGQGFPGGFPGQGFPGGFPGQGFPGGFPGQGFPGPGGPFTHMNSMNEFSDINNIFNMMFGGGMPGQGFHGQGFGGGMPEIHVFHNGGPGINIRTQTFHSTQTPDAITKNIKITIEQSYNGCSVPIDINRYVINNNSKKEENESMHINIPPGVNDNEVVTLHGRGNVINGNHGEVRIQIQITNNTDFVRQGLDLHITKKISLKDSLCGFSLEINHLNGKKMNINNTNNPTVVKPNYKKVVPALGMKRENEVGNLIIEFLVEFPEKFTAEQIEQLSAIL